MHIYIHPFVLGIIATLVVGVGICFVVGFISSKKSDNQDNTTNNGTENKQDE